MKQKSVEDERVFTAENTHRVAIHAPHQIVASMYYVNILSLVPEKKNSEVS